MAWFCSALRRQALIISLHVPLTRCSSELDLQDKVDIFERQLVEPAGRRVNDAMHIEAGGSTARSLKNSTVVQRLQRFKTRHQSDTNDVTGAHASPVEPCINWKTWELRAVLLAWCFFATVDIIVGLLFNMCFSMQQVLVLLVHRSCRLCPQARRCDKRLNARVSRGMCPKWDQEPDDEEGVDECCGPSRKVIRSCFGKRHSRSVDASPSDLHGTEPSGPVNVNDDSNYSVDNPIGANRTFEVESSTGKHMDEDFLDEDSIFNPLAPDNALHYNRRSSDVELGELAEATETESKRVTGASSQATSEGGFHSEGGSQGTEIGSNIPLDSTSVSFQRRSSHTQRHMLETAPIEEDV